MDNAVGNNLSQQFLFGSKGEILFADKSNQFQETITVSEADDKSPRVATFAQMPLTPPVGFLDR